MFRLVDPQEVGNALSLVPLNCIKSLDHDSAAMPPPITSSTFVSEYLLQPEAADGTIEQAEKCKVIILGRP